MNIVACWIKIFRDVHDTLNYRIIYTYVCMCNVHVFYNDGKCL